MYLWAWSVLFHNGKTNDWAVIPCDLLTTGAAVAVLFSRGNINAFAMLLMAQVTAFCVRLPNVTNHPVLAAIAATTMLMAMVAATDRKSSNMDQHRFIQIFAPAVRMQVLLLYFWVVFHKLNRDFFIPEWSAAVEHLENLSLTLRKLHLPPIPVNSFTAGSAIWGTLLVEAAIPILLLIPRTRIVGVLVAVVFHFVLGIEDYYDFTSLMYAGVFLFLPVSYIVGIEQGVTALRKLFAWPLRFAPGSIWLSILLIVTAANLTIEDGEVEHSFRVFKILWMIWSFGLIFVFFYGSRHKADDSLADTTFRQFVWPANVASWVLVGLVVLNGACPYLGLKTRSVFAMFSNLRTENGTTNHLFVPAGSQIFEFQTDMVQLLESSDSELQKMAESQAMMPFFNLRKMVSSMPPDRRANMSVRFMRGNQEVIVSNAATEPALSEPYPYLIRKLLLFGPINAGPYQKNRH